MKSEILSYLPLLLALIAASIALIQVRNNALLNANIQWNHEFRATLGEFICEFVIVREYTYNWLKEDDEMKDRELFHELPRKVRLMELSYNKLRLMLNEKIDDHRKVLSELEEIKKMMAKLIDDSKHTDIEKNEERLIEIGNKIIQENLESTKNWFWQKRPPS